MNRSKYLIPCILLAALALTACGAGGSAGALGGTTESGNPPIDGTDAVESYNPSRPIHTTQFESRVTQVRDSLCGKLTEQCALDVLTYPDCQELFNTAPNVVAALGFDENTYPTANDLITEEANDQVEVSAEAANTCVVSVQALSCEELAARGVYDVKSPTDFSRISEVFAGSEGCDKAAMVETTQSSDAF